MKYFRLSWYDIVYGISFQNIIMLSATIPKYDKEEKPKTKKADINDLGDILLRKK